MAYFALLEPPNLISRKTWVVEYRESWNFYTVFINSFFFVKSICHFSRENNSPFSKLKNVVSTIWQIWFHVKSESQESSFQARLCCQMGYFQTFQIGILKFKELATLSLSQRSTSTKLRRYFTISRCPSWAAKWIGVVQLALSAAEKSLFHSWISAPFRIRHCTICN